MIIIHSRYYQFIKSHLKILIFLLLMFPDVILSQTTIGYWKFNEGTGTVAYDISGNGHNGSLQSATWVSGKYGNAVWVSHSNNSYISVTGSNDFSLSPSGSFTIEAWVNASNDYVGTLAPYQGLGLYGMIVGHPTSSSNTWSLISDGNGFDFRIGGPAKHIYVTGDHHDKWVHIAVVYDANTELLRMYVNGVPGELKENGVPTGSTTWQMPNTLVMTRAGNLQFGRAENLNQHHFYGAIDEVRITNGVLNTNQFLAGYPVAEYLFNGNAIDSARNNNDGTANGAILSLDRFGIANNAYSFDGQDDYINSSTNINPGVNATFSIWFKAETIEANKCLISKYASDTAIPNPPGGSAQQRSYYLYFDNNKKLNFVVSPILHPSASAVTLTSNSAFSEFTWYNVVVSCSPASIKLYINGNLDSSTGGVSQIAQSSLPTIIGSSNYLGTSSAFHGTIDEVKIYSRVLSLTEIDSLLNSSPSIASISDTTLFALETFSRQVYASEIDGDNITFSLSTYPSGMVINSTTGEISWTPSVSQYGTHQVSVKAESQGPASISESFNISVVVLELNEISNYTVNESERIDFYVTSIYKGSGNLTCSLSSNLPSGAGASFNSNTKRFLWNTNFHSSGTYSAVFSVTDGTYTDKDTITINVTDVDFSQGGSKADTARILNSSGGTICVKNTGVYSHHQVEIPANALGNDVNVIVGPPSATNIPLSEVEQCPSTVGFFVDGENSFICEDSVTITVEYKDFEITENESNMRIHYWDNIKKYWKCVMNSQTVYVSANKVKTKVKQLTVYGVKEVRELNHTSSLSQGWNIVGIPVEPASGTTVYELFSQFISPFLFETTNSNIYEYSESSGSWILPSILEYGKGYIVYGWNSSTVVSSLGLEIIGDVTKNLSYSGGTGWNLLANPYNINLPFGNLTASDAGQTPAVYYVWNGSNYQFYLGSETTRKLSPWEGFWVKTNSTGQSITCSYPNSSIKVADNYPYDWRLKIIAFSNELMDEFNYIGTSNDSRTGYDGKDVFELESLNKKYVALFFPHEDWEDNPANFTQDIKPWNEEGLEWNFEVLTNNSDENVRLDFDFEKDIPTGYKVILTDLNTNTDILIEPEKGYQYKSSVLTMVEKVKELMPVQAHVNPEYPAKPADAGLDIRKFKLKIVKEESLFSSIPSEFSIKQNYPNPFNPETKIEYSLPYSTHVNIEIYNILGQRTITLLNENKDAGYHHIIWNGENSSGLPVSSGIYIYRIKTDSFYSLKKMILIK